MDSFAQFVSDHLAAVGLSVLQLGFDWYALAKLLSHARYIRSLQVSEVQRDARAQALNANVAAADAARAKRVRENMDEVEDRLSDLDERIARMTILPTSNRR